MLHPSRFTIMFLLLSLHFQPTRTSRPQASKLRGGLAQLVQQIPCKYPFVRSTRTLASILNIPTPVAHSAEQVFYTDKVEGAKPSWSTTETIRLDEEPVLKTGARKGCRCESIPFPPFSRSSSVAEQPADNGKIVSATLTSWSTYSGKQL